ncbi:MAG: MFS transporter [Proteobacteria bacterium]|nr:MFS transporter [Pseudomonadota bacterium]MBU4469403.1 MFS transporter [Pseudomonadota bacterium]MCG2751857.1 MFS transporter [Desulfobacteraceae bacterium]
MLPGTQAQDVSRNKIYIFGSMGLPMAMISYPLSIWLPRLYASDMGLSLALIGTVISLAAIVDAITDPIMGFVSDRFRTRWGRRKPWILIGTPVFCLSVWMLLNPTSGSTVVYLALWFIMLRIGTTLFNLPYAAWSAELSANYHTRTIIQSAREKYIMVGLIGGASIPLLVEWIAEVKLEPGFIKEKFEWLGYLSQGVLNGFSQAFSAIANVSDIKDARPSTILTYYSFGILILTPLCTLLILTFVPEVRALPAKFQVHWLKAITLLFKNKLFVRIIVIEVLIVSGEHFRNILSLFFMQDYIGVRFAGEMYVVYFAVGLLAIPFWDYLAKTYGKHISLSGAMIMVSIISMWIFFLDFGSIGYFYILFALKGFCFGAFAYLPRAMIADVVDLDTIRSGDARPATYFAVMGLMAKIGYSFGGLSLPILAWVGYEAARNPVVPNTPAEIQWLGVLYAIVPTCLFMVALYLCWTWPLTSQRHARLQILLEKKNARLRARALAEQGA